ncbi:CLUMA_CG012410, isoform A [Clunio marinus]|uniref:CLUMA_CG012410, isoform A n=1 Tax=Clunio marinus TaxID=568069 RepID=A0A1J1IEH4_9DIPT|nr:CLUMA_CG012410, isoform A [Clunio marinus]
MKRRSFKEAQVVMIKMMFKNPSLRKCVGEEDEGEKKRSAAFIHQEAAIMHHFSPFVTIMKRPLQNYVSRNSCEDYQLDDVANH